ncbi:MAG: DUF4203 domain-containing protein [Chthoniobacterales bacterium]
MQMTIATLLLAVVLLFFGQRAYWLFVGAIGFVVGLSLAVKFLPPQPEWIALVVALLAGIVGALLAVPFQRLLVALAAFLAGGHFSLLLLANLGHTLTNQSAILIFIAAGIVSAILALALLDWALIILSALTGAALIAQWAGTTPAYRTIISLVLFAIGFAVQASLFSRRRA